jgi:pimeloyl-ACP methyl ester carboxylesterase
MVQEVSSVEAPKAAQAGLSVGLAVHCSGGRAAHWSSLKSALTANWVLLTPELYNCGARGAWDGYGPYSLDREADLIVALLDQESQPVHLVGHSFGGSVALQAALRRKEKVASLTLYEPTVFQLLAHGGHEGRSAHAEIGEFAWAFEGRIAEGDYHGGAEIFVDYWNGSGAWKRLPLETRRSLALWASKGPLDFRAIFSCKTGPEELAGLPMETLVIQGGRSPKPAQVASKLLTRFLPHGRLHRVVKAGHMGPLSHGEEVARTMAQQMQRQEVKRKHGKKTGREGLSARQGQRPIHAAA